MKGLAGSVLGKDHTVSRPKVMQGGDLAEITLKRQVFSPN